MRLRSTFRIAAFAAAAFLLGGPAEAYYHYTYYLNGNRANPVRARFSVGNSSAGVTITFAVNDSGPSNYAQGDSFGSLLGEVRQAIAAWNQVSSSQLKLAFGGLEQYPQTQNAPGADITFTDLPPGLLGYASPNLPARPTTQTDANGDYVPITRSTVVLTSDTSQPPGPTYQEGFYTTAVHEIGHALGLQHTWTGAAMTPSASGRNTNRTRPVDADDVAAMLVLYGAPGWTSHYGTIAGRVNFTNNSPVSMASVVALPVNGPAVSALTNPDGSYTINGLPTNNPYLVYVHPLPPDATPSNGEGLLLPEDQNGSTVAGPNGPFQTIFFPNTLDPSLGAPSLNLTPGAPLTNVNFSVRPQSSVTLYDVQTWSYLDPGARNYTSSPGSVYINMSPAFVNATQSQVLVAAVANAGSLPTPQSVTILGGFKPAPSCNANGNISPCFTTSGANLFGYFNPPLGAGTGPRHMVFNFGNDIYVLPDAVTLVQNPPPFINSVNPNGDGTVTIAGNGFAPDTAIYLDGLQVQGTFNAGSGAITITPPPGTSGQTSVVAAYNSDGQNSNLLQYPGSPIAASPIYTFNAAGTPAIAVNTPSLPTTSQPNGFSALVDISPSNMTFVNGQATVGFGTSDITVSRVWVLSPTHLLANVVVAPNAAITQTEVSVISGFQVATQPFGFQIQPPDPTRPVIAAVVNAVGTQATVYPGAAVSIYGANLNSQITLTPEPSGQPVTVPILFSSATQVNFQVPANFPVGPAILTMGTGSSAVSLVVPIALAPPVIASIVNMNGAFVDPTHSAGIGEMLTITANGFDPTVASNPGRLQVTVGGIPMPIQSVNSSQIQFVLNHQFGGSPEPVLLIIDGSSSLPYTILAR